MYMINPADHAVAAETQRLDHATVVETKRVAFEALRNLASLREALAIPSDWTFQPNQIVFFSMTDKVLSGVIRSPFSPYSSIL